MHPEQVREIVREEIGKALTKNPIPGPSFEGGTGEEWEPKKGDSVQILRDSAFLKKDEIATVAEVATFNGAGFAFFTKDALLGWVPFSDLSPVKVIGYDPDRLPHTQVQEDLIQEQLKELEKEEEWEPEVGDWVECVDDGEALAIHRGRKYRIASFFSGRKIKIDDPTVGEIGPFKISRFKPASPPEPEVIPAEPLTELLEEGDDYWVADLEDGEARHIIWDGGNFDLSALQARLAFPYSNEGEAGAEIRAKEGLIPPPEKGSVTVSKEVLEFMKTTYESGEAMTQKYEDDLESIIGKILNLPRN